MSQYHPILSAVFTAIGAFGMFATGIGLSLVLERRKTGVSLFIDLAAALTFLGVGWCLR